MIRVVRTLLATIFQEFNFRVVRLGKDQIGYSLVNTIQSCFKMMSSFAIGDLKHGLQ